MQAKNKPVKISFYIVTSEFTDHKEIKHFTIKDNAIEYAHEMLKLGARSVTIGGK